MKTRADFPPGTKVQSDDDDNDVIHSFGVVVSHEDAAEQDEMLHFDGIDTRTKIWVRWGGNECPLYSSASDLIIIEKIEGIDIRNSFK